MSFSPDRERGRRGRRMHLEWRIRMRIRCKNPRRRRKRVGGLAQTGFHQLSDGGIFGTAYEPRYLYRPPPHSQHVSFSAATMTAAVTIRRPAHVNILRLRWPPSEYESASPGISDFCVYPLNPNPNLHSKPNHPPANEDDPDDEDNNQSTRSS